MDKPRTLFGHPIRESTTAAFYPAPMTLDQFLAAMRDNLNGFEANMRRATPENDPHGWLEPKHIEHWTEMWLAWSEIEEER